MIFTSRMPRPRRKRYLTDTEIQYAMKEVDDESIVEGVVSNSGESDISNSEADILETGSESDYEIASRESTEESEDGDLFIGKDGSEWSSISPNLQGRTSARHIIRGKVNAVTLPPGKHINHPVDAFLLYFSDEIVDNIVKYANLQGINTVGKK